MKRKDIKVKGESGVGQHQGASHTGAQVTRDQLEVPSREVPQDREVPVPASNARREDELVRLWREFCGDDEFLCRWQIADKMLPTAGAFNFSPAVEPGIRHGDAIGVITDMMMEAGFDAWYPFDPRERDASLLGMNFITIIQDVWLALDLLINKAEEEKTPDYQTPIKQRKEHGGAKQEFWSRTATALKERRERKNLQAAATEKQEEMLTPVTQRLRFSGIKESSPYEYGVAGEPYQFKAMEALREFKEREKMEKVRSQMQGISREEDLDSLFDLDTGESRPAGGQALQIQTISNWEPKPFSNKDHSGAKARDWLKKFNMYVEMANLGKIQKCQLFEMYARGEVLDWYKQLMPGTKKDWSVLSKLFVKQFCEDEQSSMKRYYSAKQGEDQTPQQYFWKLNSLGKKAGKKIIGLEDKRHVEEHIQHYMDTLRDAQVRTELRNAIIARGSTMDAVEEALKDYTRYNRMERGSSLKSALKPTKKPAAKVAVVSTYSDEESEESEEEFASFESGRTSSSSEGDCEVKRVAFADKSKTRHQKMITRSPCSHCGMENHSDDKCWKLISCRHCGRNHPDAYCNKVCKACGNVHEKGDCALEKFFYQIKEWYDPSKHAGVLPKELEEALNRDAC